MSDIQRCENCEDDYCSFCESESGHCKECQANLCENCIGIYDGLCGSCDEEAEKKLDALDIKDIRCHTCRFLTNDIDDFPCKVCSSGPMNGVFDHWVIVVK